VAYSDAVAMQQRHREALAVGKQDDRLFILEHPKVVTISRRTPPENLLLSRDVLGAKGVDVQQTDRGGDVTYHAPGQLVAWPVIALMPPERDLRGYVSALEEAVITTVAEFGVTATRIDGLRGIWVGDCKLAAIGVRLSRWLTTHGLALNVCTDLEGFEAIIPCGLQDYGVTSLRQLLGDACPSISSVARQLAGNLAVALDRGLTLLPTISDTPQRWSDGSALDWQTSAPSTGD